MTSTTKQNEKIKIGITISHFKTLQSLFSNGILQNTIFFYDLLTNIGKYDVYFIVDGNDNDYLNEMKYKQVQNTNIFEEGFNIIFTVSLRLRLDQYMLLKKNGTKNIFYNCGNLFILESESCLYNGNREHLYQKFSIFDECWNIPQHFNTNHHYLKTMLRCNIIQVPFIWSPKLIDNEENKYKKRTQIKSLAIFEPNISIIKWSFPPLLVCENAYRAFDGENKDKIKNVYIMSINDTKNFNKDKFGKLVDCLDLGMDNKITIENRHRSLYIMSNYADIAVSHTWENYLNYLYFDIAWMGWPIVHNGKLCKEVGYYYDEFNYEEGGRILKDVILHHDENADEYLERNRSYLQQYLPTNVELQKKYEDLITETLREKEITNDKKNDDVKYKFIVISACEERRRKIVKRFKRLGVPDELIHYLYASTPENSKDYLEGCNGIDDNTKKVMCCTRSHFRALEYASRDESPEYSIIVEDDVCFHKKNFIKMVEEIVKIWDVKLTKYDYVSLGWIPCRNFNQYKELESFKIESVCKISEEASFIENYRFPGTQCHMVKKERLKKISRLYGGGGDGREVKYESWKEELKSVLNANGEVNVGIAIDYILNRVLKCVIFNPMLVIECSETRSLLGHENQRDYWSVYFKGVENRRNEYEDFFESDIDHIGNRFKTTTLRNIFIYWVGYEYKLIKILRRIMELNSTKGGGYNLVFINEENKHEYVDVPNYFKKLLPAHQADYIRVNVLCEFGGIWLDSDTIVMDSLDTLFDILEKKDGFFIKQNNETIWNGIFGTKPNTTLMKSWKEDIKNILETKRENIEWEEIGNKYLQYKYETTDYFNNYEIFNGLDTVYPVNWNYCHIEFLDKPYDSYKNLIREYQPFIVLVNSVYKAYESMDSVTVSNTPLQYFIDKSFENMTQ